VVLFSKWILFKNGITVTFSTLDKYVSKTHTALFRNSNSNHIKRVHGNLKRFEDL